MLGALNSLDESYKCHMLRGTVVRNKLPLQFGYLIAISAKSCTKSGPLCKIIWKCPENSTCSVVNQTWFEWTAWECAKRPFFELNSVTCSSKKMQSTQHKKVNGVRIEPSINAAIYRNDFTEIKAKLISSRNREKDKPRWFEACESFKSKGPNLARFKLHHRNFAINFSQPNLASDFLNCIV